MFSSCCFYVFSSLQSSEMCLFVVEFLLEVEALPLVRLKLYDWSQFYNKGGLQFSKHQYKELSSTFCKHLVKSDTIYSAVITKC